MSTYIQVPVAFIDDARMFILAERLDAEHETAVGVVIRFWSWALERVGEDGEIPSDAAIHRRCFGATLDDLEAAGWVANRVIVDWDSVGAPLLRRRAGNRERQRKRREVSRVTHATVTDESLLLSQNVTTEREGERDERERIKSPNGDSRPTVADVRALVDVWNSNCAPLARVARLTSQRTAKAKTRLVEQPDLDEWAKIVARLAKSEFAATSGWANFDWLIANDTNSVKVAEGKYDNPKPKPKPGDRPWKPDAPPLSDDEVAHYRRMRNRP